MLSKDLEEKLAYYEQAYFGLDEPVPFKGGLKIYPVTVKDYYKFYSNLPCLTMDKSIKKIKSQDGTGKEIIMEVSNPQGIGMSYMAYLIECMENKEFGQLITSQVINMFELVFHEKNGMYCPNCGEKRDTFQIIKDIQDFELSLPKDIEEIEYKTKKVEFFKTYECCSKCNTRMRDVFSIKNSKPIKKLCVYDVEFSPKDLDEFIAIVTHYNILDYQGDKYVDPNLKKDMELKAELQNKNYTSPSLEKQLVCVSISSPYTIEELKKITLRKLSLMLKTIDAKGYYYAQIQGAMSGMVSFKEDPKHWIFSDNKKDMSKEIMTLNDVQTKFASVT